MSRASDLRDNLYFAHPSQKIHAIQLYCCDAYGSMLWEFGSKYADSFFKAWNAQARLAWDLPRETHTNLVVNYFCQGQQSLKTQVFLRYHKFLTKLIESPSKEIRFLVNLVKDDKRSVTSRNISYISDISSSPNILTLARWQIKKLIPKDSNVKPWRSSLLTTLLRCRWYSSQASLNLDCNQCEEMIRSLCIS